MKNLCCFFLVPVSFLILEDPEFVCWINVLGNFSMFPLLLRDGLVLPYIASNMIYISLAFILTSEMKQNNMKIVSMTDMIEMSVNNSHKYRNHLITKLSNIFLTCCGQKSPIRRRYICLSYSVILLIHLCHIILPAPNTLPDIYTFLYSVYSALNIGLIYLYMMLLHILLTYYVKLQDKTVMTIK